MSTPHSQIEPMNTPQGKEKPTRHRIIATRLPKEVSGPEGLSLWLEKRKAQIAAIEEIPSEWYDTLTKQEHGFIVVNCREFGRFVKCCNDQIQQLGFEKPLPVGQFVILKIAA